MTKVLSSHITDPFVQDRTDKYFSKSKAIVEKFGEKNVSYGVFMRRDIIAATELAVEYIKTYCPEATVTVHYKDGEFVPSGSKLMTIKGPMSLLVEHETLILMKIGFPAISAYNAYHSSMALPKVPFMDMHGRHATGDDMMISAAYGCGVGSNRAREDGAKGFIATSNDLTAKYYPTKHGVGTMPHAIIGYAGSTLRATQMYCEAHPDDQTVTVLVDFYGKEITDAIESATWFYAQPENAGKTFGVRLDTHGGRFAEGLDYNKSVDIVAKWIGCDISQTLEELQRGATVLSDAIGHDEFINLSPSERMKKDSLLFGEGVSVANVINTRNELDKAGFLDAKIIVSSGFNTAKCQLMGLLNVPIDMVGTGSFLPTSMSESYSTADIYQYNGVNTVKVGREWLFD